MTYIQIGLTLRGSVFALNIVSVFFTPDSFNEVSRYGQMENFFYGLQMHELIDVFKDQKVEFKQLLLLTEADLINMGNYYLVTI